MMSTSLHREHCVVPQAGTGLDSATITQLAAELPSWRVVEIDGASRLERVFPLRDFASALKFTERVGAMAEAENHHPAILVEWGRVTVLWWTHKVGGLHRNDFIAAAKTDRLYEEFAPPAGTW